MPARLFLYSLTHAHKHTLPHTLMYTHTLIYTHMLRYIHLLTHTNNAIHRHVFNTYNLYDELLEAGILSIRQTPE